MRASSTENKGWILALAKRATGEERKEWSMSKQKNQQDGELLPQGEFQEIEAQELEAVTGRGDTPSSPLLGGKNIPHLSDMAHRLSSAKGAYFPPDVYQEKIAQAKALFPRAPEGTNFIFHDEKKFTVTTPPDKYAPAGITTMHELP
jgi:hypothetical protein